MPEVRGRKARTRRSQVLVVCEANVCRSPLVAAILRASRVFGDVAVGSAGLHAATGSLICAVGVDIAGKSGIELDPQTRPRQLTLTDVRSARLILTAETSQRSAVAHLDPAARHRTFAVLEAVQLVTLLNQAEHAPVRSVADLTAALGSVRGLTTPGLGRRSASWDLMDGHGRNPVTHRLRARAAAHAARELVRGLESLMERASI